MSNLKLEDGFYWAKVPCGKLEVAYVISGAALDVWESEFHLEALDFGPNRQQIQKPEWCKL